MPPSGGLGLPGFRNSGSGFPGASTSRYFETYYQPQSHQAVSNTGKMASYVNYMRSRTTTSTTTVVKPQRRGSNPRPRSVSTAMNNAVKSKCGLQGCTGCHLVTPSKWDPSKGDGGPPKVRSGLGSSGPGLGFKPLFVDVSVEYELPMVPKIPPESQPLLVIHPGKLLYFFSPRLRGFHKKILHVPRNPLT